MNSQFLIFKGSGGSEVYLLDKKRNKIVLLKNGVFRDDTETCEKQYIRAKDKPTPKNGKKLGGLWYEFLNGFCDRASACIWKDDIVIETDIQIEFDKKIFEIQKEQIKWMLKMCERRIEELESGKQYYTYEFNHK